MKILFDVSALPVPGFISRSIKALSDDGMQVMVTGQTKRGLRSPFGSIPFYGRPQAALPALLFFIYRFVSLLFIHPGRLFHLWKWTGRFSMKDRIKEFNRLSIYYILKPDVIHIQWTKALLKLEYLLDHKPCPVMVSVRGTQMFVSSLDPQIDAQYKKLFPKLNAVHAVSKALANATGKYYRGRIEVIGPAVSTAQIVRKKDYQIQNKLKLVVVSRFHWVKGLNLLFDALAKLKFPWHLTLISSNSISIEYLHHLHDLKLIDHVTIKIGIPHSSVQTILPENDIFIFPGISEGRGNALLEAMASGVPVVCSEFDGAAELIQHGENGWLFENDQTESLRSILIKAIGESDSQRELIASRAIKMVQENYSPELIYTKWNKFYKVVQNT